MKCECLVCGAKITGSKDELVAAGWYGIESKIKTKIFDGVITVSWCAACKNNEHVERLNATLLIVDNLFENAMLPCDPKKQVVKR